MTRIIHICIDEDIFFKQHFKISALSDMLDEFLVMGIEEPEFKAFFDPDQWNSNHYVIRLSSPSFKECDEGAPIPRVYPIFEKDDEDDHIIKGFKGLDERIETRKESEPTFRVYKDNGIFIEAPIKGNESAYEASFKELIMVTEFWDKKTREHQIEINNVTPVTTYQGVPIKPGTSGQVLTLNESNMTAEWVTLDDFKKMYPDKSFEFVPNLVAPIDVILNGASLGTMKEICSHEWSRYEGLSSSFDMCTKCDFNRDDDGKLFRTRKG